MKKLLIMLLLFGVYSCQINTPTNKEETLGKITYIRDYKTGLCFATINSITYGGFSVTSITCVPCDSLKINFN
jgi:hypothetical protein